MDKKYNLENIGKRMPYSLPNGFFDRMQANVLAEVEKEEQLKADRKKQRHRARLVRLYLSATAVAASICVVVVMAISFLNHEEKASTTVRVNTAQVDKAYDNLSTQEQEDLNATYANDIYLSME